MEAAEPLQSLHPPLTARSGGSTRLIARLTLRPAIGTFLTGRVREELSEGLRNYVRANTTNLHGPVVSLIIGTGGDSDGRPDRDAREIEEWAREHDLPYFDESVHFPDFRLEYELDGRDRHEDIEVVTDNYRGGHAASRAQAGFTCYSSGSRGGRGGGRAFDPRVAEDFI